MTPSLGACFGGAGFSLPIRAKLGLFFLRASTSGNRFHFVPSRRLGSRSVRHPAPLGAGCRLTPYVFTWTPDEFRSTPQPYSTSTVNCCANVMDCFLAHGFGTLEAWTSHAV